MGKKSRKILKIRLKNEIKRDGRERSLSVWRGAWAWGGWDMAWGVGYGA